MIINQTVSGGGSAPAHYIEKTVDANGVLQNGSYLMDFSGVTSIGEYVLASAYENNRNITGALDLSSLTTLNNNSACYSAFWGTRISSVDLSSLESITGMSAGYGMFAYNPNLTTVNLSSLKTISGYNACQNMFSNDTGLTSIDISSLTNMTGACNQMFSVCSSLTSIVFSSLTNLNGNFVFGSGFGSCTNLANIYYPSLTATSFGSFNNQFNSMLSGVTGCTIHFPANLDPQTGDTTISSLSTYPNFGGTNTVLAFDLPSTFTLTGADTVIYTRNPKYDTATALAWKVGAYGTTNFTPAYYTSGTTDPQVNDTIYSDDACTIAVTTISAIA